MGTTLAVSLFFFLSGAAGLIYQVVWTKLLGLVLGNTVYSISVVLATFMAGLGLGSFLAARFGHRFRRPLLVYAILEGLIGLLCAPLPFLMGPMTGLFEVLSPDPTVSGFSTLLPKILVAAVLLLLPTTLMGATLPFLSQHFVKFHETLGRWLAALYSVNALGASFGALLCGLLVIPTWGLTRASFLGCFLNLVVLGGTLLFARQIALGRGKSQPVGSPEKAVAIPAKSDVSDRLAPTPDPTPTGSFHRRVILVSMAISGGAAMTEQIGWTRALSLSIGSSVYAFSIMVALFILGIAIGSALVSLVVDRWKNSLYLLAWIQILVGVATTITLWQLGDLPLRMIVLIPEHSSSFSGLLTAQAVSIAGVLLFPTLLMGASFPVAVRAYSDVRSSVGKTVGTVYTVNTLGAITGSIIGGFFLLPHLGTYGALLVAILLHLVSGVACLLPSWNFALQRPGWIDRGLPLGAGGIAVLLLVLLPRWDQRILNSGPFLYAEEYLRHQQLQGGTLRGQLSSQKLLFFEDGAAATVCVVEQTDGSRALSVNGKVDATDSGDMPTQLLLGHLPLLLHPDEPNRVLVVGLGSGATLGATLRHPEVRHADCVEIVPGVVEAARRYFSEVNGDALSDEKRDRVTVIEEDARHFLRRTPQHYDVITSEPSNPWLAGIASLFSREFFEICRERLTPGGIMCQWVHANRLSPENFKAILRTFLGSFEECLLFETIPAGDYLLLGSKRPFSIDFERIERRMSQESVVADLRKIGAESLPLLCSTMMADRAQIERFTGPGIVHTDDNAYLEFSAPRNLYDKETALELGRELLGLDEIPEVLASIEPNEASGRASPSLLADLPSFWRGRRLTRQGVILNRQGDEDGAAKAFADAHALLPDCRFLVVRLVEAKFRESYLLRKSGSEIGAVQKPLREAILLDPNDPRPHRLLTRQFLALGLLERALAEANTAIDKDPESAEGWSLLGEAQLMNQSFEHAASSYRQARERGGKNLSNDFGLAQSYLGLGRLQEAHQLFEGLTQRDPNAIEPQLGLAMTLDALGRTSEGIEILEAALEKAPPKKRPQLESVVARLGAGINTRRTATK